MRSEVSDENQARLLDAHAMALQFGWALMAPKLRVGFGLHNLTDAKVREAVAEQIVKMVAPQ